jgi:hypothetical protein
MIAVGRKADDPIETNFLGQIICVFAFIRNH